MKNRIAGKIILQTVDELLGVPKNAGTQKIDIRKIHSFAKEMNDDETIINMVLYAYST